MNQYKTVKEVCALTGLTRKHLYYFHHQKVVRASAYANYSVDGNDGYKLYDASAIEKLHQISLYYKLGLKRNEIRDIMLDANYDSSSVLNALLCKARQEREAIDRHIATLEILQRIGTKALPKFLPSISRWDPVLLPQSSSEQHLPPANQTMADFEKVLQPLFMDLINLDDADLEDTAGKELMHRIFFSAIQQMGFSGYCFLSGLFYSLTYEESVTHTFSQGLTAAHGKLALRYQQDMIITVCNKLWQIIIQDETIIGLPYSNPNVIDLITRIKEVLSAQFGITSDAEYQFILSHIEIPPYPDQKTPLNYILNALKHTCSSLG